MMRGPHPDDLDFWHVWWHGLGSDTRYVPTWWFTRRAYMAGLRDAARIMDQRSFDRTTVPHRRIPPAAWVEFVIKKIHDRYLSLAD